MVALTLLLVAEALITGNKVRVLYLTLEQYGLMVLASFFNTFGLITNTIAMQNEKSGFVTLLGYISVIYAFLGDILIFN